MYVPSTGAVVPELRRPENASRLVDADAPTGICFQER